MTTENLEALESITLAERAYRAIREAITTGELHPGQKVTERGLAQRLSVSPTPVREAIRRLEQDGLLDRTGPRTITVSAVVDTAVKDLAEVEVALRGMVARFAARHASEEQLTKLERTLDETDDLLIVAKQRFDRGESITRHLESLLDLMSQFNQTVSACSNNPVLIRLLEQTKVFSETERRQRRLAAITEDHTFSLDRYTQHRRLLQALRAGDEASAESIVIEDARSGLSDLLAQRNN